MARGGFRFVLVELSFPIPIKLLTVRIPQASGQFFERIDIFFIDLVGLVQFVLNRIDLVLNRGSGSVIDCVGIKPPIRLSEALDQNVLGDTR